jgi:RNA polymerase primary sigma factor
LIETRNTHKPATTDDEAPLDADLLESDDALDDPAADSTADEDFAAIEDPVKMYLREIGRGQLLTADDERCLACRLEERVKYRQVSEQLLRAIGRLPLPEEITAALLVRVRANLAALPIITGALGLNPDLPISRALYSQRTREAIDYFLNPDLARSIAEGLDIPIEDVYHRVVELSVESRLLPLDVTECLDLVSPPTPTEIRTLLGERTRRLAKHYEIALERAEGAERRLTEANLRLVVSVAKK